MVDDSNYVDMAKDAIDTSSQTKSDGGVSDSEFNVASTDRSGGYSTPEGHYTASGKQISSAEEIEKDPESARAKALLQQRGKVDTQSMAQDFFEKQGGSTQDFSEGLMVERAKQMPAQGDVPSTTRDKQSSERLKEFADERSMEQTGVPLGHYDADKRIQDQVQRNLQKFEESGRDKRQREAEESLAIPDADDVKMSDISEAAGGRSKELQSGEAFKPKKDTYPNEYFGVINEPASEDIMEQSMSEKEEITPDKKKDFGFFVGQMKTFSEDLVGSKEPMDAAGEEVTGLYRKKREEALTPLKQRGKKLEEREKEVEEDVEPINEELKGVRGQEEYIMENERVGYVNEQGQNVVEVPKSRIPGDKNRVEQDGTIYVTPETSKFEKGKHKPLLTEEGYSNMQKLKKEERGLIGQKKGIIKPFNEAVKEQQEGVSEFKNKFGEQGTETEKYEAAMGAIEGEYPMKQLKTEADEKVLESEGIGEYIASGAQRLGAGLAGTAVNVGRFVYDTGEKTLEGLQSKKDIVEGDATQEDVYRASVPGGARAGWDPTKDYQEGRNVMEQVDWDAVEGATVLGGGAAVGGGSKLAAKSAKALGKGSAYAGATMEGAKGLTAGVEMALEKYGDDDSEVFTEMVTEDTGKLEEYMRAGKRSEEQAVDESSTARGWAVENVPTANLWLGKKEAFQERVKQKALEDDYSEEEASELTESLTRQRFGSEVGEGLAVLGANVGAEVIGRRGYIGKGFVKRPFTQSAEVTFPAGVAEGAGAYTAQERGSYRPYDPGEAIQTGIAGGVTAGAISGGINVGRAGKMFGSLGRKSTKGYKASRIGGKSLEVGGYVYDPYEIAGDKLASLMFRSTRKRIPMSGYRGVAKGKGVSRSLGQSDSDTGRISADEAGLTQEFTVNTPTEGFTATEAETLGQPKETTNVLSETRSDTKPLTEERSYTQDISQIQSEQQSLTDTRTNLQSQPQSHLQSLTQTQTQAQPMAQTQTQAQAQTQAQTSTFGETLPFIPAGGGTLSNPTRGFGGFGPGYSEHVTENPMRLYGRKYFGQQQQGSNGRQRVQSAANRMFGRETGSGDNLRRQMGGVLDNNINSKQPIDRTGMNLKKTGLKKGSELSGGKKPTKKSVKKKL